MKYPLSRNPLPASDNQRLLRNNVAIFGGAGLLLGGVVGYRLPTERWRRVDLRAMVGRPAALGAPNPRRNCPLAHDDQ